MLPLALISTHAAAYNDVDADKYFGPYQAACESRQPRLMEIALDGLHYLIGHRPNMFLHYYRSMSALTSHALPLTEHGYLRGKRKLLSPVTSAGNEDSEDKFSNRRTLMDLVIETINKCSEDFDEGVQVQVRSMSSRMSPADFETVGIYVIYANT